MMFLASKLKMRFGESIKVKKSCWALQHSSSSAVKEQLHRNFSIDNASKNICASNGLSCTFAMKNTSSKNVAGE